MLPHAYATGGAFPDVIQLLLDTHMDSALTMYGKCSVQAHQFDALSPHAWPEPHSWTAATHLARTVGRECVSPRPHSTGKPRKPTARGVARSMLNLLAHSLFTRGVSHLARQLRSTAHEPWNGHVSRRAPDRSSIVHCRHTTQGNAYWIFNRSMHALFARVLARVPCCKPSWASRVRCWLSLNAKARSCLAYARNGRIARGSNLERCWHSSRVP